MAKRCVLEQKLLLTAYRKSYNAELSDIAKMTSNILETVRDKGLVKLVPKDHQSEMAYGESNGHV